MSHEVETMAWANEAPWHRLGTRVPGHLTPRKMQEAAGLDWEVEKVPLSYEFHGRTYRTGEYVLVRSRDGRVIDQGMKHRWQPVQNSVAFEFFEEFVRHNHMTMEVAGSLQDGKIVFVLAKMNQSFNVGQLRRDQIDGYLLFTNSHQYGRAIDIRLTPVRVVCMNTLSFALSRYSQQIVKHNHGHRFDVRAVQDVFAETLGLFGSFEEMVDLLSRKRYRKDALEKYFDTCFPYTPNVHTRNPEPDRTSANAERALKLVETQPGHQFAPGTWWNALNAVTYLTDHKIGNSDETRLQSAWYGKGDRRKQQALNLAIEYAKAA